MYEIRNLGREDAQTIKISRKKEEEEEIEDGKMNLLFFNDTERIADEVCPFYDNEKVIEFIDYGDQMKLFRELVEVELYKTPEERPNEKLSIQDAIYDVLDHLEHDTMVELEKH